MDCIDPCDPVPLRNLQVLHDMGETRTWESPEAVFLGRVPGRNVSVQIPLLQKPTAFPGEGKHHYVAILPWKGNSSSDIGCHYHLQAPGQEQYWGTDGKTGGLWFWRRMNEQVGLPP